MAYHKFRDFWPLADPGFRFCDDLASLKGAPRERKKKVALKF